MLRAKNGGVYVEELTLTAKELLFAAAKLGAPVFYGLPDPFFGMDDEEIRRETLALPLALEHKGYASVGFDDAFVLRPEAEELVSVCALCDRYIMAELTSPGGSVKNLLFYLSGSKTAELLLNGEELTLLPFNVDGIARRIWAEMGLPEAEGHPCAGSFTLPYDKLATVKEMAAADPGKAAASLREDGCSDHLAKILLDGFTMRADYHSIRSVDLKNRKLDHLVCVHTDAGALRLTPAQDKTEETWELSSIGVGELKELLNALCRGEPAAKGGAGDL